METDEFWTLIESSISGDTGEFSAPKLENALRGRSLAEIVAFDRLLSKHLADSYSLRLWGAAYLINGGCSDDGFEYFRAWLITRGREVFHAALRDPDGLAALKVEHAECEDILQSAARAYQMKT